MAGGGDVAQLAGLNRLVHILRLDETPGFPDNHHLAGTKPIVINPLRHPTRLWQVGALAMVQLIETLVMPSGDTSNMIVALIFLALYLSLCVFPVPSSVIVALYFSVACCLTPLHGSGELLCMAYTLGMLVYDTSIRFGLVVAAPVLVGIYVQAWRFPDVSWNLALNSAPVLTFLLLLILNFGQVNRNRSKLMELRLRDERAQDLMHRVKVARMIHDSVTGDLANIARVSQRQLRRCGDPEQHEAWRQINEQSVRVLDGVHAVIRQLSTETAEKHPDGAHEGLQERLNERVRVWERRLSESGIHGDVRVIDHNGAPTPFSGKDASVRQSCMLAMIDETFTNIMRHSVRGENAYNMVITLGERHLELVEMNPIPDERKTSDDIDDVLDLPGGNGLRLHREEIESLGGVMSVGEEDGTWVLYMRMPYAGPDDAEGRTPFRRR